MPQVSEPMPRRLVNAAVKPLHLVPAGLGTVVAAGLLAVGMSPLAAAVGLLSLGTWGAMVALDLRSKPGPPPPPSDPAEAVRTPHLRGLLRAVLAANARVRARVAAHDGALTLTLVELAGEADELVSAALDAARRGDAAVALLSGLDGAALAQDVEERRALALRASDPEVRRSMSEAAEAKARTLESWRELQRVVDRISAELVATEAALDELHARIARLTIDDPGDPGAGGAQVRAQLHELSTRLHALERTAAETLKEMA